MKIFDNFFANGEFDKRINKSFFALIPKVQNPSNFKEFRPICLVGCLYKIVEKVLAHSLHRVVGKVVGECQFSFIKGRQILDCALVANEVVDSVRK